MVIMRKDDLLDSRPTLRAWYIRPTLSHGKLVHCDRVRSGHPEFIELRLMMVVPYVVHVPNWQMDRVPHVKPVPSCDSFEFSITQAYQNA